MLILVSVSLVFGSTQVIKSLLGSGEQILSSSSYYNWIIRLGLNLLGYATVLLPGYIIHKYVRHSNYLQREGDCQYINILIKLHILGKIIFNIT